MNYEDKSREIDLMKYWSVIVKRKWVIMTFTGALVFLIGVFSFLATPQFRSTATLFLEEESSGVLSIDDTFGYQPRAIRDLRFYNTQIKILKTKSLAERVVRKMNLLSRPEFVSGKKTKKSVIALAKDLLTLKWIKSQKESNDEKSNSLFSSNPYSGVATAIRNNLEVKSIRDTKLVEVSFIFPSPILAAEIVNTLTQEFIDFSIEKRYATTQQASDFLSEQIARLREDLAAKSRELQRYGLEKKILFLSDTESTAVNQYADLFQQYTQARTNRINAEADYLELRELGVGSLTHIVNNPVFQQLKTEYIRIKSEFEEKSRILGPNYPEMIQLSGKLESLEDELQNELKNAVDAAESEYRVALNKEDRLESLLDKEREDVARMDSDGILYNSIKIDVENMRRQLKSLTERQKETQISARLGGLKTSNISIIERGEVPNGPFSPNKTYNLTLALLIGIFGGAGLCFLIDNLDNTLKGPEDVENLTGLPSLGVIPYLSPEGMKKKKRHNHYLRYEYSSGKDNPGSEDVIPDNAKIELVNHLHPKFFISEDYKTIRTSILLSYAENPPKIIAFTSALPKEGKTATVINMAVAFSELEKRVLVVDADLRRPQLHRTFKIGNAKGLSGVLTGRVSLKKAIQKTSVENIWLLPSGLIPPNPAELLNSKNMKEMLEEARNIFDVVLLDTAPLLAVIDSVIVSSLMEGIVLVINAGKTTRKPFLNAVEELRRSKAKIIGVLFNQLKMKRENYYFMDFYRYYRHHYYNEEEKSG